MRQLLYNQNYHNDQSVATYGTNYCYAILLLVDAFYLLRSRPFKLNLRDRYYSCGVHFSFVAITNIISALRHQIFPYNATTKNQEIAYWIVWSIEITIYSLATLFFYVMIGPVWEVFNYKLKNEKNYLIYFIFLLILFICSLIYDFIFWNDMMNIIIFLLGCVYLLIHSILNGLQRHCKYLSIIWLFILYSIIMICFGFVTQIVYNKVCETDYNNECPFPYNFNHNALWNICQICSSFMLFGAVVYEEKRKMQNSVAVISPTMSISPLSIRDGNNNTVQNDPFDVYL
eukprot:292417_1